MESAVAAWKMYLSVNKYYSYLEDVTVVWTTTKVVWKISTCCEKCYSCIEDVTAIHKLCR